MSHALFNIRHCGKWYNNKVLVYLMLFHFKGDRDLCLSNQESEELKELVHEFQYQSQQGKHFKGEHLKGKHYKGKHLKVNP